MKFNYQEEAKRTLIFEPDRKISDKEIAYCQFIIKVFISIGAIAEYFKKAVFHQRGMDWTKLYNMFRDLADLTGIIQVTWSNNSLSGKEIMILWVLTGLIGECGEITQLLYAAIFRDEGFDEKHFMEEWGDFQWYAYCLLSLLNIDAEEALKFNADKLRKRYPNGYNAQDSQLRRDVNQ